MTLRITVQGSSPCTAGMAGEIFSFTPLSMEKAGEQVRAVEQENGANQYPDVVLPGERTMSIWIQCAKRNESATFVVETESTPEGDSCSLVIDVSKMKTLKFDKEKEKSYWAPVLRPAAPY
jgi:hypothetical protein